MNDSATPAAAKPVIRLGIRGLPSLTGNMINGGLYVMIAETPSARFPILSANLANSLKGGLPCTVIVPSHPELFLQRVEASGEINASELITSNQLQLFVMQEEFTKKIFRFGAGSFVRELEQFEIPKNSYILFDQADDVLSLHDITLALDQINILKEWFSKQQVTALMVFTRVNEANSGAINALMDSMNGIARLGGDRDGLELTFDYWQSPEGTVAARSYRLSTLSSGLYEATAPTELPTTAGIRAVTEVVEDAEPHYFYMNPDLGSLAKQFPGVWKRVDTLVGMMHATRNTRSSTSILTYQRDTNLRQLAETVHTLRLSLGRYAKIVVQEKEASLRYQNEAFLLKLGINLVVHRDVPASRMPLMLESLSRQVFARDVDINFEAAMASVLPATASGYQIPSRFSREILAILDRAVTLDIPYAMVVGKPTQHATMIDILKSSGLSRPGDLVTSDGESCYIFLNACPESVLLKTLERILQMPVEAALKDIAFLIKSAEIQAELAALTRVEEMPDYSSQLGRPDSVLIPSPVVAAAPMLIMESPATTLSNDLKISIVPAAPIAVVVTTGLDMPPAIPILSPHVKVEDQFLSYNNTDASPSGVKKVARATRSEPVNSL